MIIRVGVTGSRKYKNRKRVYDVLDALLLELQYERNIGGIGDLVLINGMAHGADTLARDWAIESNVMTEDYPANWNKYGSAAGPIRNQQMKDSGLDILIAFPPGERGIKSGTAGMVKICKTNPKVKDIRKIDWPSNIN